MPVGQNPENNELNDAVEQVATEDKSPSSSSHPGNQNNQQSTAANTVATGSDSVAPLEENSEQQSEGNEQPSAEQQNEGGEQGAQPVAAEGRQSEGGAPPSQVQEGNQEEEQSSEQSGGAQQSVGSQQVGGNTPAGNEDAAQPAQQSSSSQPQSSEGSSASRAANSGEASDSKQDTQSFDVNVTPDRPIYSNELDNSDTTTDTLSFDVNVEAVNDLPDAAPTYHEIDEDGVLNFTADDLLANSTDVEGPVSLQSVEYSGEDGELVENPDGSFSFTPNENFHGDVVFDVVIEDNEGATAQTTANLHVVSVNDPVIANDDSELDAGEPSIRLDAEPENGVLQYLNENDVWEDVVVGETYSADTELQFVPDVDAVESATIDIKVGSFDSDTSTDVFDGTAQASDWGVVDGDTAVFTQDDVTITTQVTGGDLTAWNGAGTSVGAGIGDQSNNGLSHNDTLVVTIDGEDVNQITFQLDGLGGWFDESHRNATEVIITAYDEEGNVIDSQGGYRESGEFQDQYVFTTDQPVHHFELGTTGGTGTYVVQNMTVSRTLTEELQLVTIQGDGSEVTSATTLDLNYDTADQPIDVTEQLIDVDDTITTTPIQVLEDGVLVLDANDLLANDTDADGDLLSIVEVSMVDESQGAVELGENGSITFTPAPNYFGEAQFEYTATDGNGSFDTATVSVDVIPQQDAPVVDGVLTDQVDEDGLITLTQAQLLSNVTELDGESLTALNLSIDGNGVLTDNQDGTFTIEPDEHFDGSISITYEVTDGIDTVSNELQLNVEAVADAPELSVTPSADNLDGEVIRDKQNVVEFDIDASLVDQDGSEALSVTVGGAPDGSVIRYDSDAILNDQSSGLTSFTDSTVTVTFEGESAGYKNSVGYYVVEEDGSITNVNMVYSDASQQGAGGTLIPGESSFSFELEEGQSFNLFVIPNGGRYNDFESLEGGEFVFRNEDGSPASITSNDPQLIYIAEDGTESVVRGQNGDAVFHGGTSTNLNQDGVEHTRVTMNDDGELIYGIEDLYGGGDRDYDDFSFSIDLGETNQAIYSGEIVVADGEPAIIPSVVLDQTLVLEVPEGFSDDIDLVIEATSTESSNQDSATTSQTLHIDANEYAPEVSPLSDSVSEDNAITFTQDDLLANATDINGDDLTALNVSVDPAIGSVSANPDGSFTVTPLENYSGNIDVTYDVTDGTHTVPAVLNLDVEAVADAPDVSASLGAMVDTDFDTSNARDEWSTDNTHGGLEIRGEQVYTGIRDSDRGNVIELEVHRGDESNIYQNLDLQAGETVTLTFDYSARRNWEDDSDIELYFDGELIDTISQDTVGWHTYSYELTATTDNPRLEFNAPDDNSLGGLLDNIRVTEVPTEDNDIRIDISTMLTDLDGSESMQSIVLDALPEGSTLTDGTNTFDATADSNSVDVLGWNLDNLQFTPPQDFNGEVSLQLSATSVENSNGDTSTTTTDLTFNVEAVNDAPIAPTLSMEGVEDQVITIDPAFILSKVTDVDDTEFTLESLSIRTPIQASITPTQDGLYQVVVPENYNGAIDLDYEVSDGEATTEGTVNLNIMAVDDAPFQNGNAHLAVDEDGAITFNSSDLIDLFGDVDSSLTVSRVVTATGEEAEGTVVDNGNGTWTFTPTDDFAGTTGLQVVVTDGNTEASMDMNVYIRPVADGVAITTSFDGPLVFKEDTTAHFGIDIEQLDTSEVMTSVTMTGYPIGFTVSDGPNTVVITEENQAIDIGKWDLDTLTMTPPENYNGEFSVTLSVVSLDEVEDPADNEVTTELGRGEPEPSPFVLGDESYALLESEDLLELVPNSDETTTISEVSYTGDGGTLIDNNNGTWSFWGDPNYQGDIDIDFTTSDGSQHQVTLLNEDPLDEPQPVSAMAMREPAPQTSSNQEPDYTAAPGDTFDVDIPDNISGNGDVDHMLVTGLPDGVEPVQGVSDGEGGYSVSNLDAPMALKVDEAFEGEIQLEMVGIDVNDVPVEGADASASIHIDESYEMQGTSADRAGSPMSGDDSSQGDWTTQDNTDMGVDVMDDSSSFDNQNAESPVDDDLSMLSD